MTPVWVFKTISYLLLWNKRRESSERKQNWIENKFQIKWKIQNWNRIETEIILSWKLFLRFIIQKKIHFAYEKAKKLDTSFIGIYQFGNLQL